MRMLVPALNQLMRDTDILSIGRHTAAENYFPPSELCLFAVTTKTRREAIMASETSKEYDN